MEYLGGRNLFTSRFIIGCREVNREFTKTETLEIEALHKWLDFKDNDSGMDKYRTNRTQYIDFLEIIKLETFKEITEGLYKSYCNEFPYSTKKDFIKHVFDYTIFDLECFLKLDVYWLGEAPNENNYSFYTIYSHNDREFLDFAINNKFEIAHYKQYYKAVLEYLKSFDSDITEQLEKSKPELTINQIALKYVYSGIQINRENGNETAIEYGHNSGEKLFQRFTYYSSAANRKGKPSPCTPKKLNNKIKLIQSVVELLPTDKQERAKDEVSILKKIYEAEYQ